MAYRLPLAQRRKFIKNERNTTRRKNYQAKYQAITTKLTSDNKRNNKCQKIGCKITVTITAN